MSKITTKEYIRRSKEIHGDKYDYSKVEYVSVKQKVTIICPEHGEFQQRADRHLSGAGCKKCSVEARRLTLEDFIRRSNVKHNNRYEYSKARYITAAIKICITCPKHGDFWQTPNNHLSGIGCRKCGNENKARLIRDKAAKVREISNSSVEVPSGSKPLFLGKGLLHAIVDTEDYEEVSRYIWFTTRGYVTSKIGDKIVPLHRLLMGITDPEIPIDHIDNNPLNNRRDNLRVCTPANNSFNTRPHKDSISKYKGVTVSYRAKPWRATITHKGRSYALGNHETEEEAARAYDKKAKELFGEYAWLNFPDK